MDYTVFTYITEIPDVIDNRVWYELAVQSYNLGLTFVWLYLLCFVLDNLFVSLSKLYKRGHD